MKLRHLLLIILTLVLSTSYAQAGIQCFAPGFRVAACGLARNDGLVVFVIPAKAGIQGQLCRVGYDSSYS